MAFFVLLAVLELLLELELAVVQLAAAGVELVYHGTSSLKMEVAQSEQQHWGCFSLRKAKPGWSGHSLPFGETSWT